MYDFTVLVLNGQFPTGVSVSRDVLMTAEAMAPLVNCIAPKWRICSLNGGTVELQGGFSLQTAPMTKDSVQDLSVWIISGIGLNTANDVKNRLNHPEIIAMASLIKEHVEAGGYVAASCSAVFLLHVAGILKHHTVTTTWWLGSLLQEMQPECTVNTDRMVCADGQIITSGAAFAQTNLMMHLIRERLGSKLVETISRVLLIDGRVAQQAPFIVPELFANGDELICKLTRRIEDALPQVPSIKVLAAELCMSERTLSRYVQKNTGKTTFTLIQGIRFRRARKLLEESRLSVEQIAEAVGYKDATALRKLIRKITGASPNQQRIPHHTIKIH